MLVYRPDEFDEQIKLGDKEETMREYPPQV
jgi:hypothetical protein